MTEAMTEYSDEDLTAFLDGELDPGRADAVQAALETDAALAERLAALDLPTSTLRRAMAPDMLETPGLPAAFSAPATVHAQRLWVPAAIAASCAVGFLISTLMQPEKATGWTAAVASYQALYITETLTGPTQEDIRRDEVMAWASDRFDVALAPALAIDGMDFKRAQKLGFRGKPLLQIAYLQPDGTPLALCLTLVDGPDKDPEASVLFDLAGVSWVENGVGYYLVGGEDLEAVKTLTSRIRALI